MATWKKGKGKAWRNAGQRIGKFRRSCGGRCLEDDIRDDEEERREKVSVDERFLQGEVQQVLVLGKLWIGRRENAVKTCFTQKATRWTGLQLSNLMQRSF